MKLADFTRVNEVLNILAYSSYGGRWDYVSTTNDALICTGNFAKDYAVIYIDSTKEIIINIGEQNIDDVMLFNKENSEFLLEELEENIFGVIINYEDFDLDSYDKIMNTLVKYFNIL